MRIVDRCGRFLSSIVYNNIALLIAIGILRILFSPKGWIPHEEFYQLVHPMMMYLIPVMFAFTGGRFIGEFRGGLAAAFVTMGVILGSDQEYPMILAALLIGPLMGYLIKQADRWLEHRIPIGFELLIHNVVSALLSVLMALVSYLYVAPIMALLIKGIMLEMQVLISSGLLPLLAIIIEPGKVLFFNNVMNHGILEPLGISQLKHADTSIFFMLESNPGPGFGVLLALFLWKKRQERADVKAAMTIQFLGGIHEVYFPYILSRPMLILPLILGGLTGNFVFAYFHAGLVATPSPGSMLIYLALAPRHTMLVVILGVVSSILMSFGAAYLLLRWRGKKKELHAHATAEQAQIYSRALTSSTIEANNASYRTIQHVAFACDGGLASSAMGAAKLKKLLTQYPDQQINVSYCAVDRIPESADLVVLQEYLRDRLKKTASEATYLFVPSLVEPIVYEQVLQLLLEDGCINKDEPSQIASTLEEDEELLKTIPIVLDAEAST